MSLGAEILASAARKGPACSMGVVEGRLSKADLADLRIALKDTSITTSAIFRALKSRGHEVNLPGVAKHRRGDCACKAATA